MQSNPKSLGGRTYEGRYGIITGGSRGIGEAIARRLAAKGCNLLIVYTSESSRLPAQAICHDLSLEHQVHCSSVQADLSVPKEAAQQILRSAQAQFKLFPTHSQFRIDFLVNNAGVSSNQHLNDVDLGEIKSSEFERVYNVNVLAPLLLVQAVAPFFPEDRSGRIVNVSSVSSSIGYEGQSVYAGSKAALEAMTRCWSRELASRCTVNAINPGPVWGDMYAKAGQKFWSINQPYVDAAPLAHYNGNIRVKSWAGKDFELFDRLVKDSMGGRRPAFAAEVAGAVDMLCSEEAGWTTGSVICANGGMKMSIS